MKITIIDQNQFMTCYLIFNFRPTFSPYFRKITTISISHNVESQGVKNPHFIYGNEFKFDGDF